MAEPEHPGSWRILEIDFCEDAVCRFCKKKLRRGIALFVIDAEGRREPCGPTCAAKYAELPAGPIPDFTKGARENPAEDDEEPGRPKRPPTRKTAAATASKPSAKEGHPELEYLRLRVEKMADFPGARLDRLVEIHRRWQETGRLDTEDARFLKNLMAKMQREQTPWSHPNLQACYAYAYWIGRLLASDDQDYPRDLLRFLRQRRMLTEKQIAGLNKFFENRDMPTLDPLTFQNLQRSAATPPTTTTKDPA